MADIAMCRNPGCSLCEYCYRFRATPSEYQSMVLIDKVVNSVDDCDHYWPVYNEEDFKRLEEEWQD